MYDAFSRGKPVMQYVYELESKVRALVADRRRFRLASFCLGCAAGLPAGALLAAWYLR